MEGMLAITYSNLMQPVAEFLFLQSLTEFNLIQVSSSRSSLSLIPSTSPSFWDQTKTFFPCHSGHKYSSVQSPSRLQSGQQIRVFEVVLDLSYSDLMEISGVHYCQSEEFKSIVYSVNLCLSGFQLQEFCGLKRLCS